MKIRSSEVGDAEELKQSLLNIWRETYDAFLGVERVTNLTTGWHTLEKLRQEAMDEYICSLVALDGTSIVGHALMYERAPGELHLARLYLAHDYHGKGIGKHLLDEAIRAFPNAQKVQLETYEVNTKAVNFYKSQGFEVTDKLRDAYSEDELYEFVMERDLKRDEQ
ncbi:GNAT family N-acetyltransferase [Maritalea sp.]|uniref:GNAT family N-acetyltransferase n=1 Tax=Maritalea sp. TaxID=2003361 RepID=UPI003EFA7DC2